MKRRDWRYAPVVLLGGLIAADAQCRDCYHEGYEIELPAPLLLSAPPAAVLFSGYRNGRCEDDFICTATPNIAWLGNLGKAPSFTWWNYCSEREMVVFGGGHAPTPLKPAEVDATPLKPALSEPAVLALAVWVIGSDPTLGSAGEYETQTRVDHASDELVNTQRIFDVLGAGIRLDYVIKPLPWVMPDPVKDILIRADCDRARTLMDGVNDGGPMASMQDPARLNVYFVDTILFQKDGLTCYGNKDPNATRYTIFVGKVEHTPSTLAHEIGHALGLLMKPTLPDGTPTKDDDVNELALDPYFPVDNLMYSGVGDVGQITVGQMYRMHFDKRSWLWRNRPGAGGYPRECQASAVDGGVCPPLTLHPIRGWP